MRIRCKPSPEIPFFDPYQSATHRLYGIPLDLRPNINHRRRLLSVGIPHWQELLSQSEVILELLNHVVALTSGFFEFPPIHNLYRTSHVFYNPLFLQN